MLDIESSGGPFGKEAIIEIAVFRYDGSDVVDQLFSLVSPHREVQKYVSKITGITPKMLLRAPKFEEIAKRLIEITEDAIIVGHNVEFDYRMLRQEFGRLGYQFERKTLDTIKLSEELIPDLPSYGLDTVCEELDIFRGDKHRAEADARATLELFQILQEKDRQKNISILGQSVKSTEYLKDKINDIKRSVKYNKGIFYLHDSEGRLLYVGASENIKNNLDRLFISDSKLGKSLVKEVHSVKSEAVGNWLVARVKRQEEIKEAKPKYQKQRSLKLLYGIFVDKRKSEPTLYLRLLEKSGSKKPLLKCENLKSGNRALRMFRRTYRSVESQIQIIQILENLPNASGFIGQGRNKSEHCIFWLEQQQLIGYRYYKLNKEISQVEVLKKNLAPVGDPTFTELVKLGALSGEFVPNNLEEIVT